MTYPIHVALVWHHHQPLYKSPITGQYRMPWVRLHSIKDYLDLMVVLQRYPKLHQTVDLTATLLTQIEDYATGQAIDPYLQLTLTAAETLSLDQKRFILERFFDAHYPTLIEPYPRYRQLFEQRQHLGIQGCLQLWEDQDYGDLLAWHNLAWFDPLYHEDQELQDLFKRNHNYTLVDRQQIWAKQQRILAQIIPNYVQMQQSGQIELTTSPYTHPILPLLINGRSARLARPGLSLPRYGFHWEGDVDLQLAKAKQVFQRWFPEPPRGLWPSEQSVSPAILDPVLKHGFEWIISDEGVLGWSLGDVFHRDEEGHVLEPEKLYRPYRLETDTGEITIIFRDHRLSDLIGFSYSAMEADEAAKNLIGHLETIRNRLPQDKPWLVTIALDGENCWEYYPQDGHLFLDSLYRRLSQHPVIKLVTVSEFLDQFPPTVVMPGEQLHSGSWIESDFTTWIGDPVKNRAWDLLAQTRQLIEDHPRAQERTWQALWAAEGSDWFWWFGEGHSSAHDPVFDQLFREHLEVIYQDLGERVPEALLQPLDNHDGLGNRAPQGFIHPLINGRPIDQDWSRAGKVETRTSRGTMHRTSPIRQLWYGFDHFHLYLRIDFSLTVQRPDQLHVLWYYPNRSNLNSPIPIQGVPDESPLNYHYHHALQIVLDHGSLVRPHIVKTQLWVAGEYHTWHEIPSRIQTALDVCLEIAVPWSDLVIEPDQEVRFLILAVDGGRLQESVPAKGTIGIKVP